MPTIEITLATNGWIVELSGAVEVYTSVEAVVARIRQVMLLWQFEGSRRKKDRGAGFEPPHSAYCGSSKATAEGKQERGDGSEAHSQDD